MRKENFYTEQRANKELLRAQQREMIVGQLSDGQRVWLQDMLPKDRLIQHVGEDLLPLVSPLDFEKQEGDGYRLLLGLTCTAQNPIELANVFSAMQTLSGIKEPLQTEHRIYDSYHSFLQKTFLKYSPFNEVSREAKYIDSEIVQWCEKLEPRGLGKEQVSGMANTFFNPVDQKEYQKRRPYLAETFLSLILNDTYNYWWREQLLRYATNFNFSVHTVSELPNSIFADDASYWTTVDGSWVGIDITQQPESDEILLASELTEDEKEELERLRQERTIFKRGEQDWLSRRSLLRFELTNLRIDDKNLYEKLSAQMKQRKRLEEDLLKANQELWTLRQVAGGSGQREARKLRLEEMTDPFIRGFGYTTDQLESMTRAQRKKILGFLRKEAARAFHPDNGINPDNERMKEINVLLDRLS